MPYTAEHKAKTREQIVMAARAMFNCHGFDAVSIDDIMKHAGLTRGGFYNHFSSKADLFVEAVVSYVTSSPMHRRMSEQKSVPSAPKIARMLVNLYLSDEILREYGRPLPALRPALRIGARRRKAEGGLHHRDPQPRRRVPERVRARRSRRQAQGAADRGAVRGRDAAGAHDERYNAGPLAARACAGGERWRCSTRRQRRARASGARRARQRGRRHSALAKPGTPLQLIL